MNKKCFLCVWAFFLTLFFIMSRMDKVNAQPGRTLIPDTVEQAVGNNQSKSMEASAAQQSLVWAQINSDGFGYVDNLWIGALTPFNGQLYASTFSYITVGQIWRLESSGWTPITTDAFGEASKGFNDMIVFNGKIYAGSQNSLGGQIWRSTDGNSWEEVVSDGFGASKNGEIRSFQVFSDTLYATTGADSGGAEIWRSATGNAGEWTQVVGNESDWDAKNLGILSSVVYNGYYYVGTGNWTDGSEIWRSSNGEDWSQVNVNGFGDADNVSVYGLVEFNNYLYASTEHRGVAGAEIWRCQICDNSDWSKVVDIDNGTGIGTPQFSVMIVFDGQLYSFPSNGSTGFEVWRTSDGTTWDQVGYAGFGDSNNWAVRWNDSITLFNESLYIGTANTITGAEVWYIPSDLIFLPIIMR